jgi:hypothetical protein
LFEANIKKAKILEKTDEAQAKKLWLEICEFALEFSKQPGTERNFKLKIWKHIEKIISRLKTDSGIQYSSENVETKQSEEKDPEFDINSLPKVPKEDPDFLEVSENLSKPENEAKSQTEQTPFFDKIMEMEKKLKEMPESFKEISVEPYSPDKSIIPFQSKPVEPSDQVNIQKSDGNLFETPPIFDNDTIDVYKGTKDPKEIKDPFGPKDENFDEKKTELRCYACGAVIKKGEKKCPSCGSDL